MTQAEEQNAAPARRPRRKTAAKALKSASTKTATKKAAPAKKKVAAKKPAAKKSAKKPATKKMTTKAAPPREAAPADEATKASADAAAKIAESLKAAAQPDNQKLIDDLEALSEYVVDVSGRGQDVIREFMSKNKAMNCCLFNFNNF